MEQRQGFSQQLVLIPWQEEQIYLNMNMFPAGPYFNLLHLMCNNFLSIRDTSVKPNGMSSWPKGWGKQAFRYWDWGWYWKNGWLSCWEINFQEEKKMSFEFLHESTKLCFLIQTYHTPGTSRSQILASFRNFHWKCRAQWQLFKRDEKFKKKKKVQC